jgi:hypothetical protein
MKNKIDFFIYFILLLLYMSSQYNKNKFIDDTIKKHYQLLLSSNVNGVFSLKWINYLNTTKFIDYPYIKYFIDTYYFEIEKSKISYFKDYLNTFGMKWYEKNEYYLNQKINNQNNMKKFCEKYQKFEEETLQELSKLKGDFYVSFPKINNCYSGEFSCDTARRILKENLGDKLKENTTCSFKWSNN